ncbi:uncharacterized protein ACNLHF_027698 [Anomaloglossus baeobatrachus]|uniref:uncharacterized protein LOC142249266 n=1 Tax=Anomaloglossus baeobatrachus TaxID=238106 RepID=UPI003F4F8189
MMEVTQNEDNFEESEEQPSATQSPSATSASEVRPSLPNRQAVQTQENQQLEQDSTEADVESTMPPNQSTTLPIASTVTPSTISTSVHRYNPSTLRVQRRRRSEDIRSLPEIIDTQIMNIMNSLIPETDAERFCPSLAPSLAKVPCEHQDRVRAAILTLISACQTTPLPNHVLLSIEQWQTQFHSSNQDVTLPHLSQNITNPQPSTTGTQLPNPNIPSFESQHILTLPQPSMTSLFAGQTSNLMTQMTQPTRQTGPSNILTHQHPQPQSYITPTTLQTRSSFNPIAGIPQSFYLGQTSTQPFFHGPQIQTPYSYPTHTQIPPTIIYGHQISQPMLATSSQVLLPTSVADVSLVTCVTNSHTTSCVTQTISEADGNICVTQESGLTHDDFMD